MARWVLIVGPKRSDKTGIAIELAERLQGRGVTVGGFVQVKRVGQDLKKYYEIMLLQTGEHIPVASEAPAVQGSDDGFFCSLRFLQQGFDQARLRLQHEEGDATALFIGEVSKLEVSEGGHFRTLKWALSLDDTKVVVLCARADQLFYIVEKFSLQDEGLAWIELPADDTERSLFFESVVEKIQHIIS